MRENLAKAYSLTDRPVDRPGSVLRIGKKVKAIKSGDISVEPPVQCLKDLEKRLQEAKKTIETSWFVLEHEMCRMSYLQRLDMILKPYDTGKHEDDFEKQRWQHLMSPETHEPPLQWQGRGYDVPIVVSRCQCNKREAEKSVMAMVEEGLEKLNPLRRGVLTLPPGGL